MASTEQIERFKEAVQLKKDEQDVLALLEPLINDDSDAVRRALVKALSHPSELVKGKATRLLAAFMAKDLGEEYQERYGKGRKRSEKRDRLRNESKNKENALSNRKKGYKQDSGQDSGQVSEKDSHHDYDHDYNDEDSKGDFEADSENDFENDYEEDGEGGATLVVGIVPSPQLAADAAKEACLVIIHGAELGKKIELSPEKVVVIGRGRQCDISIDQDSVSRRHAQVYSEDNNIMVRDLGSTNGTYLNDKFVDTPQPLRDGDLLSIGRTIFKFFQSGNIEQAYHQEIYRLTTVDSLTQVYNKRYLLETMEREIARAHRYENELSIVMFDIDHFKEVNDTHGHLAGDHILRELSLEIRNRIRQSDIMGRYGGEEFVIILTNTGLNDAVSFAEKVRISTQQHSFNFEDKNIPITISLGVAQLEKDMETPEALIEKADTNLYRAKENGRNQVVG